MKKRKLKFLAGAALAAVLGLGAWMVTPAFAVHDIPFIFPDNTLELDDPEFTVPPPKGNKPPGPAVITGGGANAIDETEIIDPDAPDGFSPPDDWGQNNFDEVVPGTPLGNCDPTDNSCGYVTGPAVDEASPGGDAFRSVFKADPNGVGSADDVFTGGGSKDDLDISDWRWELQSPTDKNDLLPIGAAAYNVDGDTIIYYHGSLFAPNGSAAITLWLLKEELGLCGDGNGASLFGIETNGVCAPAEHSLGDVAIQVDFIGSDTALDRVEVRVFTWVAGDATVCSSQGGTLVGPNNNLCVVAESLDALCRSNGTTPLLNDDACATINIAATESPDDWGFLSKAPPASGPAHPAGTDGIDTDDFPGRSFIEGGVNITNLIGAEAGCFSSFVMSTRTSHRVRAELGDLAFGDFDLCGLEVSKTCRAAFNSGIDAFDVNFSGTVANTGVQDLDITLSDDKGDIEDVCLDPTQAGEPDLCDDPLDGSVNPTITAGVAEFTLPSGDTLAFSGVYTDDPPINEETGKFEFTDTVTASAALAGSGVEVVSEDATANCDVVGAAGLEVLKGCTATINDAGDGIDVSITGNGSNTGQLTLTNVLLTDDSSAIFDEVRVDADNDGDPSNDPTVTNGAFTLKPGQLFAYLASDSDFDTLDHSDTVTVSATHPVTGAAVQDDDPAECSAEDNPTLDVDKICSNPTIVDGDTFEADISGTITNTGDVDLENLDLSDTVFADSAITIDPDGTPGNGDDFTGDNAFNLGKGDSVSFFAKVSTTTDITHENTLTVTGVSALSVEQASDSDGTAGDATQCEVSPAPAIGILKDCDPAFGGTNATNGGGVDLVIDGSVVAAKVHNIITVTNTGNVDLTSVSVSDPFITNLTQISGPVFSCDATGCDGALEFDDVGDDDVAVFKGDYLPDGSSLGNGSSLANPDTVTFKNTATASGTGALNSGAVGPETDDSECAICQ